MAVTSKVTVRFERFVDDFLLLFIDRHDPTRAEWQAWLDFVEVGRATYRRPRVVVYSEGGAPDANQRRALESVMVPETKIAVLVDSLLGRGVVTALGWMYGNFSAFATRDLLGALRYLELPETWKTVVEQSVTTFAGATRAA
jgi:hypothetical protein